MLHFNATPSSTVELDYYAEDMPLASKSDINNTSVMSAMLL